MNRKKLKMHRMMAKVFWIKRILTKKWLMVIIGCTVVLQMLIYISEMEPERKFIPSTMNYSNVNTFVYMSQSNSNGVDDDQGMINETIMGDRNIFFLETSHIKNSYEIHLNARQGCAVESAALMNPGMKVHLFIFSAKSWNYSHMTNNILKQLKSYKNVVIQHLDLETYFENSPMMEWWNSTDHLSGSNWFTSHISDALRYFTLWKFGGIYMDLDVVVKSSLEELKNFAAAEDSWVIASGFLGFDLSDIGRRYANACLYEAITDFRGDNWAHNGPGVITRTLKKICNTYFIRRMTKDRCGGFEVFSPAAFLPIHWTDWEQYFNPVDKNKTMNILENAFAIHVWNKKSASSVIKVGSEAPYELIAKKYCPRVYKNCGDVF